MERYDLRYTVIGNDSRLLVPLRVAFSITIWDDPVNCSCGHLSPIMRRKGGELNPAVSLSHSDTKCWVCDVSLQGLGKKENQGDPGCTTENYQDFSNSILFPFVWVWHHYTTNNSWWTKRILTNALQQFCTILQPKHKCIIRGRNFPTWKYHMEFKWGVANPAIQNSVTSGDFWSFFFHFRSTRKDMPQ